MPPSHPSSTEELNASQVIHSLLPLLLESSTESVAEISSTSLERILGPAESDAFLARVYERLVTGCYNIIANHADPNRSVPGVVAIRCFAIGDFKNVVLKREQKTRQKCIILKTNVSYTFHYCSSLSMDNTSTVHTISSGANR